MDTEIVKCFYIIVMSRYVLKKGISTSFFVILL